MTFSFLFDFHLALQVSDILLLHPSLPNSFCLGPRFHESLTDLISCEANKIPFMSQDIDLDSWTDNLHAWPNPPEGWVSWYNRMVRVHQSTWEAIGIANTLSLPPSPLNKNENLLKIIGYFWSNALNYFLFGHSPMTPTLMDVVMITDEDINTSATIIPSVDIHGPITRSRAQQLNYQVNSFLCSSAYNIESRLLPNNLIVLRNQGKDYGGQMEHQEGAGEPMRCA
jgi:hypothetical protein